MHPELRTNAAGRLGARLIGLFDFSRFGRRTTSSRSSNRSTAIRARSI